MASRLTVLAVLELGAAVLRRAGLGGVVDRARDRALRRLGRFTADVGGVTLGGDAAAHSHYVRALLDDARERRLAELFEASVPAGGLVIDAGAHLGYFTLLAARRGAEVIAFEPDPRTLGHLRANVRANGVEDRVTVVPAALAGEPGRRRFHLSPAGDESSLHARSGTVDVDVDVVAADDVVGGRAVDVIKIDVEGGELEALAGMAGTIAAAPPGVRVFVECNPEALERAGASEAALLERLRALGLEPSVIDEPGLPYVNLLCVRRSVDASTSAR